MSTHTPTNNQNHIEQSRTAALDALMRRLSPTDIKTAVESFLLSVEPQLQAQEAYYHLQEVDLGTVVLDPPDPLVDTVDRLERQEETTVINSDVSPETYPIKGIQGYIDAPDIFTAEWSMLIHQSDTGRRTLARTVESPMPVSISKTAFREANNYLN